MLENFKEEQHIAFTIIKNQILNNRTVHAYLIETNDYSKSDEFVKAFVKTLFCKERYMNNSNCGLCTQCDKIDKNIFIELKIIKPDGLWIKKEQTDILQKEFSTKGIDSSKKIYVIEQAEKLNTSSSNSLLKFLEEPSDNIIAILVASNIYQIMDTIKSRCQIISLRKENSSSKDNFIKKYELENEDYNVKKEIIINFINSLENKKVDTILNINELWNNIFTNREEYIFGLDLLINYYVDVINYKLDKNLEFYTPEEIEIIFNKNNINISNIIKKISLARKAKDDIISNVNLNLIMDKLIIDFCGGIYEENNRS